MRWSRQALDDLDAALSYFEENAPDGLAAVLEAVLEAAESLSTLSARGRIVPERGDPSIRELLVLSFRLLYEVKESEIVILGLLHQRRDFERWHPSRELGEDL